MMGSQRRDSYVLGERDGESEMEREREKWRERDGAGEGEREGERDGEGERVSRFPAHEHKSVRDKECTM